MFGRIGKHALAFVAGMIIIGGLVYWSMASSINELKNLQTPILEIHLKDQNCLFSETVQDKETCSDIREVSSQGNYISYSGDKKKLSKENLKTLRELLKDNNLDKLNEGTGNNCHSRFGEKEISYNFKYSTDISKLYIPCTYSNSDQNKLFIFLEKEMGYPIYYTS